MKEMKKLIKGVIYDNPNLVEEESLSTASTLFYASQHFAEADDFINANIKTGYVPTLAEFYTSECIEFIADNNMIIPKNLVCDKLYNSLSNIDIGNRLCVDFINTTVEEKYRKPTMEDTDGLVVSITDNNGNIIWEKSCSSKEEAEAQIIAKHIEMYGSPYEKGEKLLKVLNEINELAA